MLYQFKTQTDTKGSELLYLTDFHIHNPVPIATYHDALVFGLAFIDALDDKSKMIDFRAFDGLVVVVFPSARKRETRVVHLAGIVRDVVA